MPGSPGRHIANSEPSGPGKKSAAAILLNETDDWKARARAENITRAVKQIEFPIACGCSPVSFYLRQLATGGRLCKLFLLTLLSAMILISLHSFSVAQAFMPG